ncbi:uncharacterized protein PG998_002176 [Apiospora kogelbergensis]|uniref:Uncharacterized protein n=1 Tax=Apiospora kogelbergensis TaxID=1337665 RepID=A0AAW0QAD9_9PEZI
MFSCLRWCFGGRSKDKETEKGNNDYNDPTKLDAEYQQIQRGIAERLAQANAAERIRIRDMLRDKEECTSGSSSSDTATGSLQAPQLRVMSPVMCSAPEPEPPMTAELQPVLNDLPDETRLCTSSHSEAGDARDASSLFAVGLDDE